MDQELVELIARALWLWLPAPARIGLAVAWPLIRRWVIPATVKLFSLEVADPFADPNVRVLRTVEAVEYLTVQAEPSLRAALIRAKAGR